MYRCSRLLLGRWIELEVLIMKVLGLQILDMDEKNISSYAPRAITGASKGDHEALFDILGSCLTVQNEQGGWSLLTRATQERYWAMHIKDLPGVLGLFFEVQFSDFLSGLDLLLPKDKRDPSDPGEKKILPLGESQIT